MQTCPDCGEEYLDVLEDAHRRRCETTVAGVPEDGRCPMCGDRVDGNYYAHLRTECDVR